MFVSDVKDNYSSYGLPQRFVDCLPEYCEVCGAPMDITEGLTMLQCSNPRCKDKMVMRLKTMCSDLGLLTFGEKNIEKFLDTYNIDSPMDIFGLQKGDPVNDVSQKVVDCLVDQLQAKKKMLLWEYVMYSNIPFVRTSARKIFQGYEDISEAIRDIERGGVPFIQKRLGLAGDENGLSVQSVKVYNSIMEYKEDLLKGCTYIEIIRLQNIKELNVVCSDQVGGGFSKKAEFYAYVNNTFFDKVHVNFLPSVNKNIDYLVWAGADGSPARYTSKVKSVEGYNARGANIPIVTAEQFIEIMQRL